MSEKVPYETDGLPGTAFLIRYLIASFDKENIKITLLVDERAVESTPKSFDAYEIVTLGELKKARAKFDCILTTERVCKNDKTLDYRNMRMKKLDASFIDEINAFINELRGENPDLLTISIGDGGNEFGMGKLRKLDPVPKLCSTDSQSFIMHNLMKNQNLKIFYCSRSR